MNSGSVSSLLVKGWSLISNSDFYSARNVFEEALKLDSSNKKAIVGYAYCLYRLGNKSRAKELCDGLYSNDLKGKTLNYYREIILDRNNSSSRSSSGYGSGPRSSSTFISSLLVKGWRLISNSDFYSAQNVFEEALRLDPNNVKATVGFAYCLYQFGYKDHAKQLCNYIYNGNLRGETLKYYDEIVFDRGSSGSKSSSSYSSSSRSTSRSSSASVSSLLVKGWSLISNSDFYSARNVFEEALKLDSSNKKAIVGYAYCLYRLGNKSRAKELCDGLYSNDLKGKTLNYYREIILDRNNSSSRSSSGYGSGPRSSSRSSSGYGSGPRSSSRSSSGYGSGPRSSSTSISSLLVKGWSLISNSDFYSARNIFEEALRLDSNNVKATVGFAYCLYRLGDLEHAYNLCEGLYTGYLNGNTLNYYSEILSAYSGRSSSRSSSGYGSGPRSSSTSISSLLVKGWSLISNSDFYSARNIFEEALRLDSNNVKATVGFAYCLYRLGDLEHAYNLCEGLYTGNLNGNTLNYYSEILNAYSGKSSKSTSVSKNYSSNNRKIIKLCEDGFKYIEEYKIKEAKKCFNKALKLEPNNPKAIYGNAMCLYKLGYYIPALDECEKALQIDENVVDYNFYQQVKNKAK